MLSNVVLPVMVVHKLLEPNSHGQCGVEETKRALSCCCKCIIELDLIELDWEYLTIVKVCLAIIVPFNSISYRLVALEAELCEVMLVLKLLCVTSKDMVPPVSCLDSVVRS